MSDKTIFEKVFDKVNPQVGPGKAEEAKEPKDTEQEEILRRVNKEKEDAINKKAAKRLRIKVKEDALPTDTPHTLCKTCGGNIEDCNCEVKEANVKKDAGKCKICGKPSDPKWDAEDGKFCSKKCLMTITKDTVEEGAECPGCAKTLNNMHRKDFGDFSEIEQDLKQPETLATDRSQVVFKKDNAFVARESVDFRHLLDGINKDVKENYADTCGICPDEAELGVSEPCKTDATLPIDAEMNKSAARNAEVVAKEKEIKQTVGQGCDKPCACEVEKKVEVVVEEPKEEMAVEEPKGKIVTTESKVKEVLGDVTQMSNNDLTAQVDALSNPTYGLGMKNTNQEDLRKVKTELGKRGFVSAGESKVEEEYTTSSDKSGQPANAAAAKQDVRKSAARSQAIDFRSTKANKGMGYQKQAQEAKVKEERDPWLPHISGTCVVCGKPSKIAGDRGDEYCSVRCQNAPAPKAKLRAISTPTTLGVVGRAPKLESRKRPIRERTKKEVALEIEKLTDRIADLDGEPQNADIRADYERKIKKLERELKRCSESTSEGDYYHVYKKAAPVPVSGVSDFRSIFDGVKKEFNAMPERFEDGNPPVEDDSNKVPCVNCKSTNVETFASEGDTLYKCNDCGYTVENGVETYPGNAAKKVAETKINEYDAFPGGGTGTVAADASSIPPTKVEEPKMPEITKAQNPETHDENEKQPEADEHGEKEYFGKQGDDNYYYILAVSDEGEGSQAGVASEPKPDVEPEVKPTEMAPVAEEKPLESKAIMRIPKAWNTKHIVESLSKMLISEGFSKLQIVDATGKVVADAEEQELDPNNIKDFLLKNMDDLELTEIAPDIVKKYLLADEQSTEDQELTQTPEEEKTIKNQGEPPRKGDEVAPGETVASESKEDTTMNTLLEKFKLNETATGILYVDEQCRDVFQKELDAVFGAGNWRLDGNSFDVWDLSELPETMEVPVMSGGDDYDIRLGTATITNRFYVADNPHGGGKYVECEPDTINITKGGEPAMESLLEKFGLTEPITVESLLEKFQLNEADPVVFKGREAAPATAVEEPPKEDLRDQDLTGKTITPEDMAAQKPAAEAPAPEAAPGPEAPMGAGPAPAAMPGGLAEPIAPIQAQDMSSPESAKAYIQSEYPEEPYTSTALAFADSMVADPNVYGKVRNMQWGGIWGDADALNKQAKIVGDYGNFSTAAVKAITDKFGNSAKYKLARDVRPVIYLTVRDVGAGVEPVSLSELKGISGAREVVATENPGECKIVY